MASTGHEPTRLGRERDRAPRFVRKEQTHPALPLSGTIQWRSIVGPDAFLPGSRQCLLRFVFGDRPMQSANGRAAKAELIYEDAARA